MPPAGRPRKPETRHLAPGVYARTRNGKVRYYDRAGNALGPDARKAALTVAQRAVAPVAHSSTWLGASAAYREQLAKAEMSAHTLKSYRRYLAALDATIGAAPLDSLRPLHVHQILHAVEDSPYWAAQLLMMFRQVWRRAVTAGLTERRDPSEGISRPKTAPRRVVVTDAMLLAVAAHGDQILRDWCDLSLACGQRVSDVLILTRAHIVEGELRPPNSKTGRPVRITIEGDLQAVLERLLTRPRRVSGPYLIQTERGKPVTYTMLAQRFDRAAKKARAADPTLPHFQRRDLRAKSATDSPETAQARLGHTSKTMTERHYLRETPVAKPGRIAKGEK